MNRDISHWAVWPDDDLLDQAACACQSSELRDNEIVREAIRLNIIAPLRQAFGQALYTINVLLAEARERGGSLSDGEKLGCAVLASGIEARSDATPQSGAAEGESPTAESGDAQGVKQ